MIEVGTLVKSTRDTGACRAGEIGVCYEVYDGAGRDGYSFIFEKGGHDGFADNEMYLLEILDVVVLAVADYEFTNVLTLERDFQQGRFKEAFRKVNDA
jgi:hypothetical protein